MNVAVTHTNLLLLLLLLAYFTTSTLLHTVVIEAELLSNVLTAGHLRSVNRSSQTRAIPPRFLDWGAI
jgi:hypothetical protein